MQRFVQFSPWSHSPAYGLAILLVTSMLEGLTRCACFMTVLLLRMSGLMWESLLMCSL